MKKLELSIIVMCVLGLFGCSKLKNENPAAVNAKVSIHGDGFTTSTSANFHGKVIADSTVDMKTCTECHGSDFNGGSSQVSCNGCHKNNHSGGVASPAAANFHGTVIASRNGSTQLCSTCHGKDYNGGMSGVSCNACHAKTHPGGVALKTAPNFHGLVIAAAGGNTASCTKCHGTDYNGGISNVSCNACHKHADGIIDPSSANFHGKLVGAANWTMTQCMKCHGSDYKGGISAKSCLNCHNQPKGPEDCSTCHGSSANPAPPKDVSRNTAVTARGVGAHQKHLVGGALSDGSLQCVDCHVVPTSLASPGHINTAVPNAPAQIAATATVAYTKTNLPGTAGAAPYDKGQPTYTPTPSYSAATVKCTNTYCHGNFKNGNATNAPTWNDPASGACGTCHGDVTKATLGERAMPKNTLYGNGTHYPVTYCYTCHGDVVDANWNIIDKSKHMNGKLNVFGTEIPF
jgi:predicted CxxxxCH...CXXCH cytochrome family protein